MTTQIDPTFARACAIAAFAFDGRTLPGATLGELLETIVLLAAHDIAPGMAELVRLRAMLCIGVQARELHTSAAIAAAQALINSVYEGA